MIIAIDGPSASGKGTLARKLAAHFNLLYLDTGALYRAVGLAFLQKLNAHADGNTNAPLPLREGLGVGSAENNPSPATSKGLPEAKPKMLQPLPQGERIEEAIVREAPLIAQSFKNGVPQELLNDPDLRSEEVGMLAGKVSAIPAVRQHLLELQKQFAAQPGGAVLDGRDIGTVIAPHADVKIFVTASAEKRAQRRFKELAEKELQLGGKTATYEAVLKDMQERDARDAARPIAPTKPADDAVLLDTDDKDADAAFAGALAIVREKTGRF